MRVTTVAARNHLGAAVTAAPTYYGMLGHGFPCTVTALPGVGGTINIATSTTPGAESNPAGVVWTDWPSGAVSAATSLTLNSPVCAIRVTAATAAGSFTVVG